MVGSAIDTALFFFIAFSAVLAFAEPSNDVSWANEALPLLGTGPVVPLWVSLGLADFCVKLTIALIALVPFRLLVQRLRAALLSLPGSYLASEPIQHQQGVKRSCFISWEGCTATLAAQLSLPVPLCSPFTES